MCGENFVPLLILEKEQGSPPRVRGKRLKLQLHINKGRITPACAGKTFKCSSQKEHSEDHPRVCGENTLEMAYFRG